MKVYLDLVVLLNFLVDLLLLIGANRLTGFPQRWGRLLLAAALGGMYSGICILPELSFLGRGIWPVLLLAVIAMIAFGMGTNALRRGTLFAVLSLALGGFATSMEVNGFVGMIAGAMAMCILCIIGFRGSSAGREFVDLSLAYRGKTIRITAMQDTGNTLLDPLTGEAVLVVSCNVAQQLLGLSKQQLRSPVETLAAKPLPGLRLLPYATVEGSGGFLLALRMDCEERDGHRRSRLVAFSPEQLDKEGAYHALTGGVV